MKKEAFSFNTTSKRSEWLRTVARKSNKSVDFLLNVLIDGYLEDIEDGTEKGTSVFSL